MNNWPFVDVHKSEILASHWENIVRSEHNINLRGNYKIDQTTNPISYKGSLLIPGTTQSKFFFHAIGELPENDRPYDYSEKYDPVMGVGSSNY